MDLPTEIHLTKYRIRKFELSANLAEAHEDYYTASVGYARAALLHTKLLGLQDRRCGHTVGYFEPEPGLLDPGMTFYRCVKCGRIMDAGEFVATFRS